MRDQGWEKKLVADVALARQERDAVEAKDWPEITTATNEDLALVFQVAAKGGVQMYGGFLTAIYAGVLAERERASSVR